MRSLIVFLLVTCYAIGQDSIDIYGQKPKIKSQVTFEQARTKAKDQNKPLVLWVNLNPENYDDLFSGLGESAIQFSVTSYNGSNAHRVSVIGDDGNEYYVQESSIKQGTTAKLMKAYADSKVPLLRKDVGISDGTIGAYSPFRSTSVVFYGSPPVKVYSAPVSTSYVAAPVVYRAAPTVLVSSPPVYVSAPRYATGAYLGNGRFDTFTGRPAPPGLISAPGARFPLDGPFRRRFRAFLGLLGASHDS